MEMPNKGYESFDRPRVADGKPVLVMFDSQRLIKDRPCYKYRRNFLVKRLAVQHSEKKPSKAIKMSAISHEYSEIDLRLVLGM